MRPFSMAIIDFSAEQMEIFIMVMENLADLSIKLINEENFEK